LARAGLDLSILVTLSMVGASASAAAETRWSLSGDLAGGGGYDSNLFLQVAASPESPNFHAYSGGFLRLDPAIEGALAGDGVRVAARYDAGLTQTFGAGRLIVQGGDLSLWLPELGPVGLRLAATAGRFDASAFPSDRFWSWGARGALSLRLGDALRASAQYDLDRRIFGDPALIQIRSDLGQSARLRLDGRAGAELALGADAEYLVLNSDLVDPTLGTGHLRRLRGGLGATYTPRATVTVAASLWAGTQSSDSVEIDRQVGGALAASLRASASLDLVARYDLLVDRARGTGSDYTRNLVSLALVGHRSVPPPRDLAALTVPSPPPAEPDSDTGQAPRLEGGRVRFRLRAADARRVTVIGSWNDWAADDARQRLDRVGQSGLWEGWLALGPGAHRYHFLVDGRPLRPVDAPRYRADDFGGEDGVIEVPDAASGDATR
jgi:hypothetical protein